MMMIVLFMLFNFLTMEFLTTAFNISYTTTPASSTISNSTFSSYLAVCLWVKDEQDIREWVSYHYHMGVSMIYIIDDHSEQPLINKLLDFSDAGIVHYEYSNYKTRFKSNRHTYDMCIKRYRNNHKFMAFIDSDASI